MAFGPKQILEASKKLMEEYINECEAEIDKIMIQHPICVHSKEFMITFEKRIIDDNGWKILKQRYLDAGWKSVELGPVKYTEDPPIWGKSYQTITFKM